MPGRIFHELMPSKIRKLLAAFYTRPQAAEILANLIIERSDDTVLDPACGSGTILTATYRRKLELFEAEKRKGNPHKQFCEKDIFGMDIMPFVVHLTTANLAAMNPEVTIEKTQIIKGNSLKLAPYNLVRPRLYQFKLFQEPLYAHEMTGEEYKVELKNVKLFS